MAGCGRTKRWGGAVAGAVGAALALWGTAAAASDLCPLPPAPPVPSATASETASETPPLAHTREALAAGRALTVVALGSSSTQGAGASSAARTYPAQLQALLGQRLANAHVAVLNRGIGGETAAANLERLERDVIAVRPDLVVWQVGTNDGFQKVSLPAFITTVREGAARMRDSGADLVLMTPQFFPDETRVANYGAFVEAVRALGRELAAPVVDRHTVMKWWLDSGRFTAAAILSPDGYHMRDPSYRCLAEMVADVVAAPSPTPQRTAAR